MLFPVSSDFSQAWKNRETRKWGRKKMKRDGFAASCVYPGTIIRAICMENLLLCRSSIFPRWKGHIGWGGVYQGRAVPPPYFICNRPLSIYIKQFIGRKVICNVCRRVAAIWSSDTSKPHAILMSEICSITYSST